MGPIGPVRSCIGKTREMKYTHISEVVEVHRVVHGVLAHEHRRLMIEPEKGRPAVGEFRHETGGEIVPGPMHYESGRLAHKLCEALMLPLCPRVLILVKTFETPWRVAQKGLVDYYRN